MGSAGILVFTHVCSEDGAYRSFFTKQKLHCANENTEVLPSCCAKQQNENSNQKIHSNCCEEQTHLFKVRFDYQSEFDLFWTLYVSQATITHSKFISLHSNEAHLTRQKYRPPPLQESGEELRILNQVFLL
jgi:hypothetical protein